MNYDPSTNEVFYRGQWWDLETYDRIRAAELQYEEENGAGQIDEEEQT